MPSQHYNFHLFKKNFFSKSQNKPFLIKKKSYKACHVVYVNHVTTKPVSSMCFWQMHFYYRESSRGPCGSQADWICESGSCGILTNTEPVVTDSAAENLWCQSEVYMATNVTSNGPFILR